MVENQNETLQENERESRREARRERKRRKKIRKALRSHKFRFWKNLGIWFVGVTSSGIITLSAIVGVVGLVPLKTLTGENGVSQQLANSSVLDLVFNLDQYGMSDVMFAYDAIIEAIDDSLVEDFVTIDREKLKEIKFGYTDGRNFGDELKSCIKVVASLDSVNITPMLGDLSGLSIFSQYESVASEDMPTVDANGYIQKEGDDFKFNPALYYYQTGSGENVEYERAFDDEGKMLCTAGTTLYYPNIADIPLLDTMNVLSDSMGRLQINELLATFGAGDAFNDSFLGSVLEGKRISDLSTIQASDFTLSSILGDGNDQLYGILVNAAQVDKNENGVIDDDEVVTKETLNIGHLQNLDINRVPINEVLTLDAQTEKLIRDAVNAELGAGNELGEDDPLKIEHFGMINTSNIKLDTVMPYGETNKLMYKVLLDSKGIDVSDEGKVAEEAKKLTVGELSFNTDKIHLTTVLPDGDEQLYNVLVEATGVANKEALTVNNLTTFDTNSIKLNSVMPYGETNKLMYKVLLDSKGIDVSDEDKVVKEAKKLTVGELSFNTEKVHLTTVMSDTDEELFNILVDATGVANKNELTLKHLETFELDNLHLSKVMTDGGNNKILNLLLEDDTVTISNLDDKINNLKVADIYGTTTFATAENGEVYYKATKATGEIYYVHNGATNFYSESLYTYDTENNAKKAYYISSNANIWLNVLYERVEIDDKTHDDNGYALAYKDKQLTFDGLSAGVAAMSAQMMSSTIRELSLAGVMTGDYDALMNVSLESVLNIANSYIPQLP